MMKETIEQYIESYKKSTITLEQLESLFVGARVDPASFAEAVLALEQAGVLEAVKSAGRTVRHPSLAYRYRIHKQRRSAGYRQRLQQYRLVLHPAIQLDSYYARPESEFDQDKPWIDLIDRYLKQVGFPDMDVPAPERSYQITGNEKWITDLGGHALLRQLGLWERIRIYPVSDPLMMAVNPAALCRPSKMCDAPSVHLIVENKTTFQALLPILSESACHTLIYGCGNKITGNIDMFPLQYPLANVEPHFYYFGDIDYEGIRIWHDTHRRCPMRLALPFYQACLSYPAAEGKTYQRKDEEALEAFLNYFPSEQQKSIRMCLESGGYYPQEILTTVQLQHIWRSSQWRQWVEWNSNQ